MNDKQYEKHKRVVERAVVRWCKRLWIGRGWEIAVVHERGGIQRGESQSSGVLMNVKTEWQYMRATITCDCRNMVEDTPKEQEKTVLHELLHVVLNETKETTPDGGGEDHEDRVVTHLETAFWSAFGEFDR